MADPVAARKYLEASLPLGQWAAASHAIGHDHAYIQQYIRRGVPRYLNEVDRDQLVKLYGLDADRLRPPPRTANLTRFRVVAGQKALNKRGDQADVDPLRLDELVSKPGVLELVSAYLRIASEDQKELALNIVNALGQNPLERPDENTISMLG